MVTGLIFICIMTMYSTGARGDIARFVMTHDSLDELRAILPPGLTCLARHPSDPPEIVETWL